MANLGMTFNPDEVEEDAFEPKPKGRYLAQMIESKVEKTKAGTGDKLNTTWEILDGPLQGQRFWINNINIANQSPDAQRIGQQLLAKLCKGAGTGPVSDSEELHFIPMYVDVDIQPGKGDFGPKNIIRKCWEAGSAQPAQAAKPAAAKATPATKAAAPGGRPWSNRAA